MQNRKSINSDIVNSGPVLSQQQQLDMCAPFRAEDVNNALWEINELKSPGPDGYTSRFFKESWDCVGKDITEAVLQFFTSGKMLKQINTTTLTLIPKVENPEMVTQFRSIACCNIVYKIIKCYVND